MTSISNGDLHALGLGELLLIAIESEELRCAEVECGGDVQNVGETMSVLLGVAGAEILGDSMHVGPVSRHNFKHLGPQVRLQVPQHPNRRK